MRWECQVPLHLVECIILKIIIALMYELRTSKNVAMLWTYTLQHIKLLLTVISFMPTCMHLFCSNVHVLIVCYSVVCDIVSYIIICYNVIVLNYVLVYVSLCGTIIYRCSCDISPEWSPLSGEVKPTVKIKPVGILFRICVVLVHLGLVKPVRCVYIISYIWIESYMGWGVRQVCPTVWHVFDVEPG